MVNHRGLMSNVRTIVPQSSSISLAHLKLFRIYQITYCTCVSKKIILAIREVGEAKIFTMK